MRYARSELSGPSRGLNTCPEKTQSDPEKRTAWSRSERRGRARGATAGLNGPHLPSAPPGEPRETFREPLRSDLRGIGSKKTKGKENENLVFPAEERILNHPHSVACKLF